MRFLPTLRVRNSGKGEGRTGKGKTAAAPLFSLFPFPFRGLLAAALAACCLFARAEEVKVLVQSSPLAGSQFYALSSVWDEIRPGDKLLLKRQPENRHDANAIRVEWNGRQLGYVPRAENRALAAAMDRGERVEARVSALRKHRNPWQRVEFEVYLVL